MLIIILCTIFICTLCSIAILRVLHGHYKVKTPAKIFGVYSNPGHWYYVKYVTFLCILVCRRLIKDLKKSWYYGGKAFSKNNLTKEEILERLQPLSNHDKAFDAVFFQAVSQDGIYLCGGTERRHGGIINGLFYVAIPEYGLLLSEKLPNTVLNADPASIHLMQSYSAEGISFSPIVPMKKWEVVYNGKMRMQTNPQRLVEVKVQANWLSNRPYFSFDDDMCYTTLARAIAREKWNENLFKSLNQAHQSHYEQMGKLKGTLTIEGKEYPLELDAFRDHSFGYKRDWSLMHRYIFHMLYLKNGTRLTLGVVSQPCTTSHLEMGYIVHRNKTIDPIDSCDLLLYQHGENGRPPRNWNFCCTAKGIIYEVCVEVEHEAVHYVGNNVEAKMVERFIGCTVNGVKGRGISEWHYNNTKNLK